ncbi:MerR family transcriptional regulator [Nocardia salmonicida]|uniref:MerR family transcriptional regulator n=1 Tax=Nocardia TaxID=1817 RepID=UPI002657CE45|nr:MerR family transcriptional regulator [Nocardia sp. PE-7]WKG06966.1 MerR family transcriptional regulator [Nocardia sp. PE-7]
MTATPDGPQAATELTVGTVARLLGVPVATLRSWNQRYDLGPRGHLPGRHRHYTGADLAVATKMVELVRAGATPGSAAQAARTVRAPEPELGAVDPVIIAAENMDISRLLDLLAAHITHHGVVPTWNQLCRPAFEYIVTRQQQGRGYIDVEHLLSWAITTSLHRCVPPLTDAGREPEIVLACTAGEHHVLPLEILRAALAEKGRAALLLGANVPDDALAQSLSRRTHPAVVVLWSQTPATAAPAALHAVAGHGPVMSAGPGWTDVAVGRRLSSLEEAVDVLSNPVL